MYFIFGFLIGGVCGVFSMAIICAGHDADCNREVEKLKFRLYGKRKED